MSGALGQTLAQSDLPENETEWRNVLRLSRVHLATNMLRWSLREQRLFLDLPSDIVEFLDVFYALNLDHNRRCVDQLAHLTQTLNSIDVAPLPLKGAATFVNGLYPTLGERMISDIDVLIPAPRLPEILNKLASVGYQPIYTGRDLPNPQGFESQGHHYPPVINPDWPARVELHVHPVHLPLIKVLASEDVFRDATALSWRGGELLLPSPTNFITHNIVHASADFRRTNFLSLRQLFEFVHVIRSSGDQIDWDVIKHRFEDCGYRNYLRGYVAFANAYFGCQLPPGINIGGEDRLRQKLHQTSVENSAVAWLLFIPNVIFRRARSLRNNPHDFKKLLNRGFYRRFWREVGDGPIDLV